MYCPSCGQRVEENQKFCAECGHSLVRVTDPTEAIPVEGLPDIAALPTQEISVRAPIPDPHWGVPTGEIPLVATEPDAPAPTPTDEVPSLVTAAPPPVDVFATTQIPFQPLDPANTATGDEPDEITDEIPELFDGSGDLYEYPPGRDPFKFKLVFILAFFGAIAVLLTAVADIIDIRTSAPVDGIATGVRTLDTLGTNLAVAGFFGATVMVLGGLLACFGFRWGAGLAGGAGLALTGWAAMVAGLAELRIASAESITRQTIDLAFTLKVTRDLGFWLIVAVAVIGLLVFLASLRSIGTGGRPALNPWIAALGAVAGVVLVAGPLLPEGTATFANNYRSARASRPAHRLLRWPAHPARADWWSHRVRPADRAGVRPRAGRRQRERGVLDVAEFAARPGHIPTRHCRRKLWRQQRNAACSYHGGDEPHAPHADRQCGTRNRRPPAPDASLLTSRATHGGRQRSTYPLLGLTSHTSASTAF